VQLRAKQKLKRYYANIVESQFRGIYDEAIRMKGDSGANMIGLWSAASTPRSIARSSCRRSFAAASSSTTATSR
jgi:hypothetical protein